MKTLSIPIDTTALNALRLEQSVIIRRAYTYAKNGSTIKAISTRIPKNIDGFLHQCGIQRGIDTHTASIKKLALDQKAYAKKLASKKPCKKLPNNPTGKIVFGGKNNYVRRCKGLITNTEWKALRVMPLYSIGQANRNGNRRFRIDYQSRTLTYRDKQNTFTFEIPILKPNWEIILRELADKAGNGRMPLTFTVSQNMVQITYNEELLDYFKNKYKPYSKSIYRYLGIDLNPNRIGVSVYDTRSQSTIYSEIFEFTSTDQEIRNRQISLWCQSIAKIMRHYQVSRVGMEELTVESEDRGKGTRFNGQVNQWIRNFIQGKMRMICSLADVNFCKINPAYSSFIGCLLSPHLGDACGAASEIARRCSYAKSEFYPKLISSDALVHRWKEMANVEIDTWVNLYQEFKNRHVRWRSLPAYSRSSKFDTYSKRLLIYQMGVL